MRVLRFRCSSCGLEMVLDKRPDKCLSCGSHEIVRQGWRLRARSKTDDKNHQECGQE